MKAVVLAVTCAALLASPAHAVYVYGNARCPSRDTKDQCNHVSAEGKCRWTRAAAPRRGIDAHGNKRCVWVGGGPTDCRLVNVEFAGMDDLSRENFCREAEHCRWSNYWKWCGAQRDPLFDAIVGDKTPSYEPFALGTEYRGDPCKTHHDQADCKSDAFCLWKNSDEVCGRTQCVSISVTERDSSQSTRKKALFYDLNTQIDNMACGEAFTQRDCLLLGRERHLDAPCVWTMSELGTGTTEGVCYQEPMDGPGLYPSYAMYADIHDGLPHDTDGHNDQYDITSMTMANRIHTVEFLNNPPCEWQKSDHYTKTETCAKAAYEIMKRNTADDASGDGNANIGDNSDDYDYCNNAAPYCGVRAGVCAYQLANNCDKYKQYLASHHDDDCNKNVLNVDDWRLKYDISWPNSNPNVEPMTTYAAYSLGAPLIAYLAAQGSDVQTETAKKISALYTAVHRDQSIVDDLTIINKLFTEDNGHPMCFNIVGGDINEGDGRNFSILDIATNENGHSFAQMNNMAIWALAIGMMPCQNCNYQTGFCSPGDPIFAKFGRYGGRLTNGENINRDDFDYYDMTGDLGSTLWMKNAILDSQTPLIERFRPSTGQSSFNGDPYSFGGEYQLEKEEKE